MTIAELKRHALDLPAEERQTLAETLWESLEREAATGLPLHDWQKKLLNERIEEAERNPAIWVSSEEVEEEIRAALAARRR
jgi:putative addiction module component (TIGR02574 family)